MSRNSLQANLTNANLEGALVTGNTSFKGSIITGAGTYYIWLYHCFLFYKNLVNLHRFHGCPSQRRSKGIPL